MPYHHGAFLDLFGDPRVTLVALQFRSQAHDSSADGSKVVEALSHSVLVGYRDEHTQQ